MGQSATRSEYEKYIDSPEWAARRTRYFQSHPKVCAKCKSAEQINLHHRNYDRVGCELDDDLVALCRRCHERVHELHRRSRRATLELVTMRFLAGQMSPPKIGSSRRRAHVGAVRRKGHAVRR